jgi:hypothetical protein
MMKWFGEVVLVVFLGVSGCNFNSEEVSVFSFAFDFSASDEGWDGDFSDYPEGDSVLYELEFAHDLLPANLSQTRKGLKLSGNNMSDDLFMFIRRKISGLKPNTSYRVLFNVRFASNAPTGDFGIGGAPGESVIVKAGATTMKPVKQLSDGYYQMNIDKGNQLQPGADMMVLGNVGVSPTTTQYSEVPRSNSSANPFRVTTNGQGELWVIVGTDSGFEGRTTLYYTSINVLLNAD